MQKIGAPKSAGKSDLKTKTFEQHAGRTNVLVAPLDEAYEDVRLPLIRAAESLFVLNSEMEIVHERQALKSTKPSISIQFLSWLDFTYGVKRFATITLLKFRAFCGLHFFF